LLENLVSIVILGLAASFCPIQVAFLTPFAVRLLSSGKSPGRALEFSLSFSIPLILVGAAASQLGSLFNAEYVKFASGALLLFLSLFVFRILKLRRERRLRLEGFGSRGVTLGLLYGVLTVGRGAPFLLSTLIILSNLRSMLVSIAAMLIYSQLMVLPILILIMAAGWKVKDRLRKYGKALDFSVGVMLVVLAVYYIASALGLA